MPNEPAAPDNDAARIIDLRATNAGDKTNEPEVWLRSTSLSSISAHVTFTGGGISVKLTGWHKPAATGLMRFGWPQGQMTLQHHEAVRLRNLLSQWLAMSEQPDPGEYLVIRLDETMGLTDPVGGAQAARRRVGGRPGRRVASHRGEPPPRVTVPEQLPELIVAHPGSLVGHRTNPPYCCGPSLFNPRGSGG
jgi:hypothetical protein